MSTGLNSGPGLCRGGARLLLRPVQAVIELGAAGDVMMAALTAVHQANRSGPADDYIATALPGMTMGRNCMLPGREVELIGSEAALARLLRAEPVERLLRRGMIPAPEIGAVFAAPGETGASWSRDRASEKHTPGWIRRSQARAARRGKDPGQPVTPRGHDPAALTLHIGSTILHVRMQHGVIGEAPMLVGTYGFSPAGAPVVLPVLPDAALAQAGFDAA
ncbi:hypothetical protein [Pseudoxanthobacter sp.]|uniref:hypothetical protein n=1 Tax=Pseudoxanthobacter sp. TaxID=1925742 RepID=UPI002FE2405C